MTWRYDESQKDNTGFLRMFIAFLQSCITQNAPYTESVRPEFVPHMVRLEKRIRPFPSLSNGEVMPGVHVVKSNQWGAITATDSIGKQMGICPDECIVLEMWPNPHLKRNQGDSDAT